MQPPETKHILDVTGLTREILAITRRLARLGREATAEEKAEIVELQRKLRNARRGEYL